MAAGPNTPTTYAAKADMAQNTQYAVQAHMSIVEYAMTVTGEDTTATTTYEATGFTKRQALAGEVIGEAHRIKETQAGNTPPVIQRVWVGVLADWATDKDPDVKADLINQVASRWDDLAGLVWADKKHA